MAGSGLAGLVRISRKGANQSTVTLRMGPPCVCVADGDGEKVKEAIAGGIIGPSDDRR